MSIHFHKNDLPDGLDFGASVAIDTETQGLSMVRDKLCLVQLSAGDGDFEDAISYVKSEISRVNEKVKPKKKRKKKKKSNKKRKEK